MRRWLRREIVLPLMRTVKWTVTVKWFGQSLLGELGVRQHLWGQVIFHLDIPEHKWIPQQFLNLHPNPHPNVESSLQQSLLQLVRQSLSLMGNMCSCSRLCGTTRGSSTLSLFRRRGRQKTDE